MQLSRLGVAALSALLDPVSSVARVPNGAVADVEVGAVLAADATAVRALLYGGGAFACGRAEDGRCGLLADALGRCEATLSDAFDVVLAAEVIYEPEHPRLVARTIARRLRLDAAASAGLAEDTNETGDSGESTSCRAPPTALLALGVRSARRTPGVRLLSVVLGVRQGA